MHSARDGAYRNVMPGFGGPPDATAPSEFDYDMWLGPAPKRPYNPRRGLYHFRWFWDYSGGQMTNLGAHSIDIMQWFMGHKGPTLVSATGGRFALQDNGETPDTQDAIFQYGNFNGAFSLREASQGSRDGSVLEFFGTKGSLQIERGGFTVISDQKSDPANSIPTFQGHTAGGPQRSQTKPEQWTQPMKEPGSSAEQFDLHARNFLDAIKTRQKPVADAEEGHRTAVTCHLANISTRLGRSLRWDPEKERIHADKEASLMLTRPYRKPWDAVLKGIMA
ncbi:MAG: Gfo/Idh/MocA family oxidoreductase [Bryobacteraceae bacterium]